MYWKNYCWMKNLQSDKPIVCNMKNSWTELSKCSIMNIVIILLMLCAVLNPASICSNLWIENDHASSNGQKVIPQHSLLRETWMKWIWTCFQPYVCMLWMSWYMMINGFLLDFWMIWKSQQIVYKCQKWIFYKNTCKMISKLKQFFEISC